MEKIAFRQSKTFIPNACGLPIAGVQSVQIRFECPKEHFLDKNRVNFPFSLPDGWFL
ncbi:hypothetical protein B4110_0384 [Parageobacillus toebii]|uniref:Uncharacterized protein n=1 Tax=Parageobacillus toebii TaxID=153151 RepID=A0A150MAR8_9BACL|nr:hypothetical protein B4110_0384 [Parageobacillus toebii]